MAAQWAAAGAAGSTLIRNEGASVVYAAEEEGLRTGREVKGGGGGGGGSGKDGDQFGSKAFTQKSYDGFAEDYDDLDGGWAASAIGMEVSERVKPRAASSRAWRPLFHSLVNKWANM